MDISKRDVISMMDYSVGDNLALSTYGKTVMSEGLYQGSKNLTCWGYWQDYYYPKVIRESYPVYVRERAEDKGQKAFEIIKHLQDKKLIKLDKVSDFIEAMDSLIKIL